MHPNDDDKQNSTRLRRSERYAAGYVDEPSMSAPKPMPGMTGAAKGIDKAAVQPDATGYRADWSPPYPTQPSGNQPYASGWSNPYPAQPMGSQTYRSYPAQQPGGQAHSADWSQPYPAQPAGYQMAQPFPMSPKGGADNSAAWSQPYQTPDNGWQQTYQPQSAYDPAASQPKADDGGDGSGNRSSGMGKLIILSCLVGVLLGVAFWGFGFIGENNAVNDAVSAYNDLFCQGVYVDGIHLGGMTQDEAVQVVTANAQQRLDAWNIRLTLGEGEKEGLVRRITAADLGMTVNVHEALEAAWAPGHSSISPAVRKSEMDALLSEPYSGYTALPSGDTTVVDRILDELAAIMYKQPQDAYVSGFDPAAHSYPFEIVPEVVGSYLDVAPVKQQIYDMVARMESGTIRLTPYAVYPAVTEQMLRSERTLLGTALTEISTTSTEGRTANIQRAFELINGTTLKPGDSFSFNGIVGARSAKNGFHLAIEYAYGQEREGYGGGVCQASTTIYLAAVRANMTITKREPHSDKVNYTDYGLDATVNIDGKKIDLTFKNTTNSNVYILSYLVRGNGRWNCKVDIYGPAHEEGVSYDLVAETVEILPAPTEPEYVEDKTGTHVIYIDEKPVVKRKASDGVIVETYKVKYLNGEEIERTFVARDTYKAKSQQLWVGVTDR